MNKKKQAIKRMRNRNTLLTYYNQDYNDNEQKIYNFQNAERYKETHENCKVHHTFLVAIKLVISLTTLVIFIIII
jgi:hypothetical protein